MVGQYRILPENRLDFEGVGIARDQVQELQRQDSRSGLVAGLVGRGSEIPVAGEPLRRFVEDGAGCGVRALDERFRDEFAAGFFEGGNRFRRQAVGVLLIQQARKSVREFRERGGLEKRQQIYGAMPGTDSDRRGGEVPVGKNFNEKGSSHIRVGVSP